MTPSHYVICVLILSALGIALSVTNSRIAPCPKNIRTNILLEIGFVIMFVLSILVSYYHLHVILIQYGMLFFLALTVLYVGWSTITHLFDHQIRRTHLCTARVYHTKIRELTNDSGTGERDNIDNHSAIQG